MDLLFYALLFIVVGSTVPGQGAAPDAWLLRIDGQGALVWDRHLGGDGEDEAPAVVPMLSGAFVVAGRARAPGGAVWNAWVFQVTANGDLTAGR